MAKKGSSPDLEVQKRLRYVMEWVIEDWPYHDIIAQIRKQWEVSERTATRYIAKAKALWIEKAEADLQEKRLLTIERLKKHKRTLKEQYKGTPAGLFALMAIEKEIIKLEIPVGPIKIEHAGKDGGPIKTETTHRVLFEDYAE